LVKPKMAKGFYGQKPINSEKKKY